jgi:glycosyltransferase involved in cell wall biosynthesis
MPVGEELAKPFVSVLIDTYNHQRFIATAIDSVLAQDFPVSDREIIVIDDGSTDQTPEIIRKFEPHVRLVRKANGGQASAFNAGIPECTGEIIAFLDGDDWWAPAKLRRVSEVFRSDADVGLVGHGIFESSENGGENPIIPEKEDRLRLDSLRAAQVFRLRRSYLGTSRMTMRAAIANKVLPIPEALIFEADEYVFTMAAAISDIRILRDVLTYYRIHADNLFVSARGDGLRRKMKVLAALAKALKVDLAKNGVPGDVNDCVVEIVQAEADQLRLMLDGGTPFETVRTERKLYEVLHGDSPTQHRLFRAILMLIACVLPPRWFYGARGYLTAQSWYRMARKKVLPVPEITRMTLSSHEPGNIEKSGPKHGQRV